MSQMLRIGSNVTTSSRHLTRLNPNYGFDLSFINKSPVYDLSPINRNGFNVESNECFGRSVVSTIGCDSNDLRQSPEKSSTDLQSFEWSTGFWNNINNSAQLLTKSNIDLDYNNDNKDVMNGFEKKNPFVGQTYESVMPFVEEYPQFGCSAPVGTPRMSGQSVDTYYIQPRMRRRLPTLMECVFCKNNDEEPHFYRSHILKDPESRIMCPILRAYDCPICHNGGGDHAHTVRYCPLNRAGVHVKLANMSSVNHYNQLHNNGSNSINTHYHEKNESKRIRRKRRSK